MMLEEGFPDTPPQQPGCAAETQQFCLLLNQRWAWQRQEQIILPEALTPKARICAVLGEENPGWEPTLLSRGAVSGSRS